jgi:hypothetical protein
MSEIHEPVIAEGGRRCEDCGLLPEEHDAWPQGASVWVATLDTSGMVRDGRRIIAVAVTRDGARQAAYDQWRKRDWLDGSDIPDVAALHDYYGISCHEVPLGGAVDLD